MCCMATLGIASMERIWLPSKQRTVRAEKFIWAISFTIVPRWLLPALSFINLRWVLAPSIRWCPLLAAWFLLSISLFLNPTTYLTYRYFLSLKRCLLKCHHIIYYHFSYYEIFFYYTFFHFFSRKQIFIERISLMNFTFISFSYLF